jgi:Holliday junction resolvase RusA-like endonuclease
VPRSYTLTILLPQPRLRRALSPNGRAHWGVRYQARRVLQEATLAALLAARPPVPRPLAPPVQVAARFQFPDRRRRDPDNLVALLKPVLDLLQAYGALVDDDHAAVALGPLTLTIAPGPATLVCTLTPANRGGAATCPPAPAVVS